MYFAAMGFGAFTAAANRVLIICTSTISFPKVEAEATTMRTVFVLVRSATLPNQTSFGFRMRWDCLEMMMVRL
jgi:hypothetical protein